MGPKRVRIRPLRYAYLPMKLRCPTCANIDTPVAGGGDVMVATKSGVGTRTGSDADVDDKMSSLGKMSK